LYMEMVRTKEMRFANEFGDLFSVNGMVKAAVTALVYGYVPHGLGITQVKKYIDGLRYFIKNDEHYKDLASELFSVETRFKTYMRILNYVAKIWEHITSGKSKVSKMILERIEEKWIDRYTKSEKRFINGIEKGINKLPYYKTTVNSIFVGVKGLDLSRMLVKRELLKLTTDNILYHAVVKYILNGGSYKFKEISLAKLLFGIWRNNYKNVEFTFSDLAYADLKDNLRKLYKTTGYLTKRLGKKAYKEDWRWINTYQELYEEMLDYLLTKDPRLNAFKDRIKPLIKKLIDITNGQIWQGSLAEYINKIVKFDIDFVSKILDYVKERYEPYFLTWHGHRLVQLILDYFYDNGIDYDATPEDILHRISKHDPDLAFEEESEELLEELAV